MAGRAWAGLGPAGILYPGLPPRARFASICVVAVVANSNQYRSYTMLSRTLARLADLHRHLSPLRSADSALLKACHFDTQLDELQSIQTDLCRLRDVDLELSNLGGALELLLQLLDSAHNKQIDGGHLHCLLQPLLSKLLSAEKAMDEIL